MEDNPTTVLTISDLINSGSPLTAASSLLPSRPIDPHRASNQNPRCLKPICHNPNVQTLKPLNPSALLIGTINLPSSDNRLKCNCFRFSDDDSTAICCEILEFDAKMIGQKIRILAWNFIPFRHEIKGRNVGFLEIITWEFFQAGSGSVCSFSDYSCSCLSLGACDVGDSVPTLILGVIESISPVLVVPWESGGGDSRGVNGFLVHVLVCECVYCASKLLVSKLRGVCERNLKDHQFIHSKIVYFCGLTSLWHPVISRFIGVVVLLMGLKKKLVFLRQEESQLMYLTTDRVSLHVAKLSKEGGLNQNTFIRGKGECGNYTGVVTGIYMHGMILELDQDVILLLTGHHLMLPHYVRVGVLVTLKNVHFVNPNFCWGKMLILGACARTSMHLESFSPLESWCQLKQQYPSFLQKFVDSLSYAARLWALLVVSCFGKIFAGISSEKILGSKHVTNLITLNFSRIMSLKCIRKSKLMSTITRCSQKEGLAQKYASLHLPSSAFQIRHGVLLEFCRHDDICSHDKEVDYGQLKLVLPIANLISYCEASWKNVFNSQESYPDVIGGIDKKSSLCCGGKSYVQSARRVLRSEDVGVVVLGTLKISSSSRRLQLVDATGSVDFILDLPQAWDFQRTFEAKDFMLIMEDRCSEMAELSSTIYQPLSCRSIFSNALPSRGLNTSIYLYHCPSDEDSRSRSLFFECKENSQDFNSGKYHLLCLTHKFPIQQKFLGALSKMPNMFAEAIVLPWDLLVAGKYKDAMPATIFSDHRKDPLKRFAKTREHFAPKRCKTEHSAQVSNSRVDAAGNVSRSHCDGVCISHGNAHKENRCSNNGIVLSCQHIGGVKNHWMGMLHRDSKRAEVFSCKQPRRVLLEFAPDCVFKYESLKIGCCYLVKEENYQVSHAKVFFSSGTQLRRLTLSSIQSIQSADLSDEFRFCNLFDSSDELTKGFHKLEIPCLIGDSMDSESYSDVSIFVPSSAINLLENYTKIRDGGSNEPGDSFKEESSIHDLSRLIINSSKQSFGTSFSDCPLPQGNIISLHGLVLAIHDCRGVDTHAQHGHYLGQGSKLTFLHENAGICVHVLVDNHIVRIFGDRSKETCPIGLGRDVYATFHRVLALSEPDKYMMTAVSFITVDHASLMRGHHDHEHSNASTIVVSRNVAPEDTVPIALISDALQLSELRAVQFRCKVVALYILVLEKARSTAIIHSRDQSIQSAFGIPFAGFIIDDGSSSCCCWADSKTAASFLGLDSEEFLLKDSPGQCNAGKGKGKTQISTVGRLNKALVRHGRIVVKNCSSMFDSSCLDLQFSVNSEVDLLQRLVSKLILGPSLRIDGSRMDSKTTTWLKKRLSELDFAFPPLLNIWATSVCRTDPLFEARSIIRELV